MSHHAWYDAWLERKRKYATAAELQLAAGRFHALAAGKGLPAIHQTSTFPFHSVDDGAARFLGVSKSGEKPFARIYTRLGNPTTEHLERVLFQLECQHIIDNALAADERTPTIGVLACASGMAAISSVLMALVRTGDELIAGNVYGCTDSLLRTLEARFGVKVHWVDVTKAAEVERCLEANPRVVAVYLESPDNPTLAISDLAAVAAAAEARRVPLVVDNTFASPYLQQPFRLGADIVVHSLTKYVNGHSASIAGCALGPFSFMQDHVFPIYKDFGPTPSPFDSWLNALCVQDLGHRMEASCRSALEIARFLEAHPRVQRVHYPGLASHPQHALAARQMRLGGAMISFELRGGMKPARRLMNFFARKDTPMELAVSLGSAVSYIEHPASMTHAGVPQADRLSRGITDELVRLSVGLEGTDILIDALGWGLQGGRR
ncbi:MAG: aminotransferase class I/II-fold pyridoxal phosphate-dependent enzyme [Candidatus Wallbacteria bacterium]|nr:aminotransferase class I/II-fold pyridoxal phosphate-dependent enzyme [Candidatus Wallbacteria bacterium]